MREASQVTVRQRSERTLDGAAARNPGSDQEPPFPCLLVLSKSALGMDEEYLQQRTDSLQVLVTI